MCQHLEATTATSLGLLRRVVLGAVLAIAALGCDRSDGPTMPNVGPDSIVRVEVLPQTFRIDWVQDRFDSLYSVRLWTSETDTVPVGDRVVTWRSLNPLVARIDASGTLDGRDLGTATIEAEVSGVRGTARVDVGALGLGAVVGVLMYPAVQWAARGDVAHVTYEVLRERDGFDFPVWSGEPIDSAWSLDPGVITVTTLDRLGIARAVAIGNGTGRVVVSRQTYSDTVIIEVREPLLPAPLMSEVVMTPGRACGRTVVDSRYLCWPSPNAGPYDPLQPPSRREYLDTDTPFASLAITRSSTCGLSATGRASCWGPNYYGTLGTGDSIPRNAPDTVFGGHRFTAIATGSDATCGIRTDATAMCWGFAYYGATGTGNLINATIPTAVIGGHRFLAISTGSGHTCAIRIDRAVMCWGYGLGGQIGDGTRSHRWAPTRVFGLTDVVALSAGENTTCAVRSGGDVHCWGGNLWGTAGDGTSTVRATPVRVLGIPPFVEVKMGFTLACGRTAGGEAYCWGLLEGFDTSGAPPVPQRPMLVPGGHLFAEIDVGEGTACGRKDSGTVWCWGSNFFGQIGDGTNISRWSPRLLRGN